MTAPFTLSWLVVAPITAPAAAPMAASRFVFFLIVVPDEVDAVVPFDVPADDPDEPDDVRRVDVAPLDLRVELPLALAGDVETVAGGPATSPGAWFCSIGDIESIWTVGATERALSTFDVSLFVHAIAATSKRPERKTRFMIRSVETFPERAFDMPGISLLRTG